MKKIIVALDNMTYASMMKLAGLLKDKVWGFKVNDALLHYGARIIYDLKDVSRSNVMADPKLFDIPNTVKNSIRVLNSYGVDIVTVHALAGADVLKAAKDAAQDKTKIFAITVLTSDNDENRDYEVRKRCYIAQSAKVDGIVCAASDLEKIKDIDLLKIVPGIRPSGSVKGEDQVHTSSIIPPLADYVVVGRAIVDSNDPVSVVEKLQQGN